MAGPRVVDHPILPGPAGLAACAGLRIGWHDVPLARPGSTGDATLLVSVSGPLEGRLGNRPIRLNGPWAALFLPDRDWNRAALQAFEGLSLRLESPRLERAAAVVSGQRWSPRQFTGLLREAVMIDAGEGPVQRHLQRLELVSRMLNPLAGHPLEETEPLALDELVARLVVLALWGDRLPSQSEQSGAALSDRDSILEELVAWIRANSHRPLQLAELERRSGYSDRSLRNAFQERFGCAPKQWIRRTRMEAARQRLLNPDPGDSVSSIARNHGYQHVSQFSRDFRDVFGQRPSLVMRQARRTLI